jgi:hypothetical protein
MRDRTRADSGDERLLGRLRQLSLVELDSLLAGASGQRYAELVAAHAGDLLDALEQARRRMNELGREIASGPDPLGVLDAAPAVRARGGAGSEGPARLAARLVDRAGACRDLARLQEAAALLLPRLFEIERRRGGQDR